MYEVYALGTPVIVDVAWRVSPDWGRDHSQDLGKGRLEQTCQNLRLFLTGVLPKQWARLSEPP